MSSLSVRYVTIVPAHKCEDTAIICHHFGRVQLLSQSSSWRLLQVLIILTIAHEFFPPYVVFHEFEEVEEFHSILPSDTLYRKH